MSSFLAGWVVGLLTSILPAIAFAVWVYLDYCDLRRNAKLVAQALKDRPPRINDEIIWREVTR